ncbi:MAG: aspartate/glutamate racemase family protein [Sneathiella sp.]|uniref:aspartate/glutamate racemase family protein n=1 Tax=Sneathiella sp. TaxID=1964365 RepID=UPI0030021361
MTASSDIQYGGKGLFGASVGILMLDAQFPRIPGDMGNALTWPFPVHYKIVRGASPELVVREQASGLLNDFIDAARDLVRDGADGITTNCGFLSLFQAELAAAVGVPVATSSLMQIPMVEKLLPPSKRAGILTISAQTLTEAHLDGAGVARDTPVMGTEGGTEFTRVILNNETVMDVTKAREDMLTAGREFVAAHENLGAIVLECTNMVPYAADLRRELGLPVFSIYSFINWFQSSLMPPVFTTEILDPRR